MKIRSTRSISRISANPHRSTEERAAEAFHHEQGAIVHLSKEARERLKEQAQQHEDDTTEDGTTEDGGAESRASGPEERA